MPSVVPSAPTQTPTLLSATVVTNKFELVLYEVAASSFGAAERAAAEAAVAVFCGVSASAVVITSVTDEPSASSGRLVVDVQWTTSVKLAFKVIL